MTHPSGPERPQDHGPRLAGWWSRVGATLIDAVILSAVVLFAAIVAVIVAAPFGGSEDLSGPLVLLFAFLLCSAYYPLVMTRRGAHNGQTLGKQALGIKVVRDDGAPVATKLTLVREVLLKFIVGNVTFGFGGLINSLWPLVDGENRALHDLVVKTHVVEARRPPVQAWTQPQPQAQTQTQPALAPAIARHLHAARATEARIREAVDRAALPYTDVCNEVDSLVRVMHESARRAQLLHEVLEETPVAKVEQRLHELAGSDKTGLVDALNQQLVVQRRMQAQLDRYSDEMERVVVELDTVRGSLISVSASTDVANQEHIAGEVRGLRDEIGAGAEGMSEAFDRGR